MLVSFGLSAFRRKTGACTLKLAALGGAAVLLGVTAVLPARAYELYQYDALGRLTRVTYPNGAVVQYSYDAAGNRSVVSSSTTPPPPPPPPSNRPPVAVDDTGIEVETYSTSGLYVLDNDSDPDGDTLTITGVSGAGASIGGGGTYIAYTSGSMGNRTVSYTVSDGRGGTASATAYIFVYRDFGLTAGGVSAGDQANAPSSLAPPNANESAPVSGEAATPNSTPSEG